MSYKLSCNLVGHELDVRNVTTSPDGGIITVSRDKSCRVWTNEEGSGNYIQSNIFYGHLGYVSSVCFMQPSEKHPQGLVITGGNDNVILVFNYDSPEPIERLEGHQGTVCSLDAGKFGTILSGSWDKTAKVWISGKEVMSLEGHTEAVWCVKMMADQGLMLTGSADKTIKLWKAGKCEKTFTGHQDCVRCLALISVHEFLSCSNDGTVRRWSLSGDCVQIYRGHTNYVYSIAIIPNCPNSFVSSGEDRCVKVWKGSSFWSGYDDCAQTITLPCQSVWAVAALENGDIVAASSDSTGRVFSCDATRQASEDLIKEFEEAVANQAIPAAAKLNSANADILMKKIGDVVKKREQKKSLDLGEIKVEQLPGPEALFTPGTHSDQTKLIKKNGIVEAHQWDGNRWQKIGDVTGAAGEEGSKRSSGKQMYEGKEYDYVFSVDIEDGKPHLKLPFNLTDDPWFAAQKFLEKNDISQGYLDEVAHFIMKNTEGITLGAANPQYSDPFTGGGRYVPGSSNSSGSGGFGADPFTGGGRYVPGSTNSGSKGTTSPQKRGETQYFPEKSYLKFGGGKQELIISKLKEFNSSVEQALKLSSTELQNLSDALTNLLKGGVNFQDDAYQSVLQCIQKLSNWPQSNMIPVLDTIRLLTLNERFSNDFFGGSYADEFVGKLLAVVRNLEPAAHSMLVYRIYSNCFLHNKSALHMYRKRKKVMECCEKCAVLQNKNLSIALSTFIVNTSVYYCRNNSDIEDKIEISNLICELLSCLHESEAIFRLLVALGTLLHNNDDIKAFLQSLELKKILEAIVEKSDIEKVKNCATQIVQRIG